MALFSPKLEGKTVFMFVDFSFEDMEVRRLALLEFDEAQQSSNSRRNSWDPLM